ncbi:MAG: amino acid adenylation domain-containing protein [Acidobacteriota bacterium]
MSPSNVAFPASFAQQRLWFLEQLVPETATYHMAALVRFEGDLDVPALTRGFNSIFARHEALRTAFAESDGRPVQMVVPELRLEMPFEDLSGLRQKQLERRMDEIVKSETRRPFDLKQLPLVRTFLLKLAPDRHRLVLTVHHIVCDGWSVSLLVRELAAHYAAELAGGTPEVPELQIQYADFAHWQRQWLQGDVVDEHLDFWREKLGEGPPNLDLPGMRKRPTALSFRGSTLPVALKSKTVDAARRLAQQREATLFIVLLASFKALLFRVTGESVLAVGSPFANRPRAELESLIGFFVNMQALITEVGDNPSFADLVARVREGLLDAHAHQDLPLERVVEELLPDRDPSRAPLFQVVFSLQTAPLPSLELPGLTMDFDHVPTGTSKFDLMLDLSDREHEVAGYLEYSTDLFDSTTASRMARYYLSLLEGALTDPEQRLLELSLLSEAERHQLSVEWNDTDRLRPTAETVDALFAANAKAHPEALAVVCGDQTATYGELANRARQVACWLGERGVGPGDRVALLLARSVDAVAAMLGVLESGAAYVPLDERFPVARWSYMLSDCDAAALITDRHELPEVELPSRVLHLGNDADELTPASGVESSRRARPTDLCYVIYTSGSTGKPKGVAVEHRHLVSYTLGVSERLELSGLKNFGSVSTLAADLGHTAVFPALCSGATLHLLDRDRVVDPEALSDYVEDHALDLLKVVPSHLEALLDGAEDSAAGERVLPRKRLVLGGEAARAGLIDELRRRAPACRVFNHYGPSEATVGVLTHPLERHGVEPSLPLGRPLPGARAVVLSADLRLQPLGVPGELYLAGATVSRGYWRQPALTAERFLPSPFGSRGGERLYRTGDRVFRLPSGELMFLGRCDDQLKFNGYRIEPQEIRLALNEHSDVRDSLVRLGTDAADRPVLGAYYVARRPIPTEDLRDKLSQSLAVEVLPTVFVHLTRLPLTLNGKINHQALPPLDLARGPSRKEMPRTPTEEQLAEIWSQVLGLDRIGIRESFFALGGHSLLATRVLSRIRRSFSIDLQLRVIFEQPTIAGLALEITRRQAENLDPGELAQLVDEISALPQDALASILQGEADSAQGSETS